MALFSFWVFASASTGIFSLNTGKRFEGDIQTYALARSAVPYVQKILEDDETPKHDGESEAMLSSSNLYAPQAWGEGKLEIYAEFPNAYTGNPEKKPGLLDEERKLNLNTIDTDTLKAFFRLTLGLKEKEIEALAESIVDWRDEDNDRHESGAEKFEYLVLKKPYECKNGPFESIEELLLVKGMTPEIVRIVRPYVTVYGSGKVNLNTAPGKVLNALGLSEGGAAGIILYRMGVDAEANTADDAALTRIQSIGAELGGYIPAEDLNKIQQLLKDERAGIGSSAFSFTAKAERDSRTTQIDMVMKRDGEILYWREW